MIRRAKKNSRFSLTFFVALALVAGFPALILSSNASGTTGTIEAVAGDYGVPNPSNVPEGTAATSGNLDIPTGVTVDPEGNYLIASDAGGLKVLANSATNPGYSLQADCGGGSTQCTWTVGDLYTVLSGSGTVFNGISDLDFAGNDEGNVSFDQDGNILIPLGSSYDLVVVIAMSSTNPGYTMRSTCGAMHNLLCTWTQGDVYFVAGTYGQAGFTDGASAASSTLETPVSTVVDSQGNVLILDESGAVVVDAISSSNPGYPLASDCGGGSSACTWTPGDVFRIAGTYAAGSSQDGSSALSWDFDTPLGMTLDSSGNVVIGDTGNNTVEVLAVSASNPGYVLGAACGVVYNPCTWSDGHVYDVNYYAATGGTTTTTNGVALSAVQAAPGGISFDTQGNLLIPNYSADDLDMLALSNCSSNCSYGLGSYTQGHMYLIAGIGNASGSSPYGDGGAASSANLGGPGTTFTGYNFAGSIPVSSTVAFDPTTGDVVLEDTPLNTVRSFTSGIAPTTTTTSTTTTTTTIHHVPATTTTTAAPTTTTTLTPTTTTTMAPRPPVHVNVYFALGQSVLSPADLARLVSVARSVVREHIGGLNVVGYSDPLSSGRAATSLGASRARVVTNFLERAFALLGATSVHIGYRSGGVLHYSPYSRDRVAVVTS